MKKFRVTLARTAVRLCEIEVEAEDEDQAHAAALEQAGDVDFSDGLECGAEYDVHFIKGA